MQNRQQTTSHHFQFRFNSRSLFLLAPYLLKYDMHGSSLFSWINVSCKICIFEVGGMAFFAFIQAPHELLKQNNTTRRKMAKFFVNIVSQSYKSSNTGVALSRWGGLSNVNKKGSSRVSEMSSLTHFSWKWLICVFIIVFKVQHIAILSSRLIFSRFSSMGNVLTRWFLVWTVNLIVKCQYNCIINLKVYFSHLKF